MRPKLLPTALLLIAAAASAATFPQGRTDALGPDAARAKLHLVVEEASRAAGTERDRAAFRNSQVLVNLFETETAITGVAISIGGDQIFVTFTPAHLRDASVDVLVREALQQFMHATASLPGYEFPEWCEALPRPEYKSLERMPVSDPWFEVYMPPGFEVYRPASQVFAIYEPHQSEETIGYLIIGEKRALLFDTGMGISDVKNLTAELTKLPIVVLNSHTHDDHVGGNWQFDTVYGMDTDFTRANAKGSREDAQAEIAPGEICGDLPKNFDAKTYATKPWKISRFLHDGDKIDLGNRTIEVIATPGHTPDAICLLDRANGLLFTGDTYYPAPIWLFRPETDLKAYAASIKRIAALAPQLKLVLGAHNVPVAPPSVLPRLVTAFQQARQGKGEVKPQGDGRILRTVDGFSFLLRAP